MKTTLAALLVLFGLSAQASACPDISGVYTCGEEEITVDTYELNGVTYLEFNNQGGIPADNNWMDLPDSEKEKNAKMRLSCGDKDAYGPHYLLDYEADLYDQGQYLAFLDAEIYVYQEKDTLFQVTTGLAKGSWGEQPISDKIACTRK